MAKPALNGNEILFSEELTSARATALFTFLALLFIALTPLLFSRGVLLSFIIVSALLAFFFIFCALNYCTLMVSITSQDIHLKFGLIHWRVPLGEIENAYIDQLPGMLRYGGAGVHFFVVRKIYRVSFNFLEHPRVAVRLRRARGLVREVSFSTRQPEQIMALLGSLSVPLNPMDVQSE